jgi:hypothetical protein
MAGNNANLDRAVDPVRALGLERREGTLGVANSLHIMSTVTGSAAPMALAPLIIRWGENTSSDLLPAISTMHLLRRRGCRLAASKRSLQRHCVDFSCESGGLELRPMR